MAAKKKKIETPKKLKTFRLSGDIIRAGYVTIEAETKEDAVRLAESGEFIIDDETGEMAFEWDGNPVREA